MTDWLSLDDWILVRTERAQIRKDQEWEIPENTMNFKNGIQKDVEELSKQLGIKITLVVDIP